MPEQELTTAALRGSYRDLLRDAEGRVIWERPVQKNAIVVDCRRLLAAFVGGTTPALGIQGLWVGAGDPNWDVAPLPAQPTDTRLTDQNPWFLSRTDPDFKIDFLDPSTGAVISTPTHRLQIAAKIGPGKPPWQPGGDHPAGPTLREFGLVGKLGNNLVLINAVRHAAIAKDPLSTLERTIWLTF
jgi:hypothetical protein